MQHGCESFGRRIGYDLGHGHERVMTPSTLPPPPGGRSVLHGREGAWETPARSVLRPEHAGRDSVQGTTTTSERPVDKGRQYPTNQPPPPPHATRLY